MSYELFERLVNLIAVDNITSFYNLQQTVWCQANKLVKQYNVNEPNSSRQQEKSNSTKGPNKGRHDVSGWYREIEKVKRTRTFRADRVKGSEIRVNKINRESQVCRGSINRTAPSRSLIYLFIPLFIPVMCLFVFVRVRAVSSPTFTSPRIPSPLRGAPPTTGLSVTQWC